MNKSKTIAVLSSSRADFGLLRPLIDEILLGDCELRLLVTGSHLVDSLGKTISEIESLGYEVTASFDILHNDAATRMDVAFSEAVLLFGEYFSHTKPDMLVILGDRYESLAVAIAASMHHVEIAHISGGDVTIGALDDAYRHSITKLSILHFTSTEVYRKRVIQLGESPERVFNVGALGVENISKLSLLTKEQLGNETGFNFAKDYILCTYHPETLSDSAVSDDAEDLLGALSVVGIPVLFTKANADEGGATINNLIESYCDTHKDCMLVDSLGTLRYLSAMKYAKAVVGNSSSAIIEGSAFKVPVVNIGMRQVGRVMGDNVICCNNSRMTIEKALCMAIAKDFSDDIADMKNPYEGIDVAKNILKRIMDYLDSSEGVVKFFYDVRFKLE